MSKRTYKTIQGKKIILKENIVNNEYWLEYAESSIDNSLTKINEGAAKLEKLTIWFWTTYTAVFTIGVSINIIEAPLLVLGLLASPIISTIGTYWCCVNAQLPVHGRFDPRIPYEIKKAFTAGIEVKNKRLRRARLLTFISACLLSLALFSLAFVSKKSTHSFDVFYDPMESVIVVSGIFLEGAIVTTEIDSIVTTEIDLLDSKSQRVTFHQNIYKVKENGILNLNIPIKTLPQKVIATTTWIENNEEKGFTQTLTNK